MLARVSNPKSTILLTHLAAAGVHQSWANAVSDVTELFSIQVHRCHATKMSDETDQWLNGAIDIGKVQIALNLDVYPFSDFATMEQVLSKVAATFPEVAYRCRNHFESRPRAS